MQLSGDLAHLSLPPPFIRERPLQAQAQIPLWHCRPLQLSVFPSHCCLSQNFTMASPMFLNPADCRPASQLQKLVVVLQAFWRPPQGAWPIMAPALQRVPERQERQLQVPKKRPRQRPFAPQSPWEKHLPAGEHGAGVPPLPSVPLLSARFISIQSLSSSARSSMSISASSISSISSRQPEMETASRRRERRTNLKEAIS